MSVNKAERFILCDEEAAKVSTYCFLQMSAEYVICTSLYLGTRFTFWHYRKLFVSYTYLHKLKWKKEIIWHHWQSHIPFYTRLLPIVNLSDSLYTGRFFICFCKILWKVTNQKIFNYHLDFKLKIAKTPCNIPIIRNENLALTIPAGTLHWNNANCTKLLLFFFFL